MAKLMAFIVLVSVCEGFATCCGEMGSELVSLLPGPAAAPQRLLDVS